MTKTKANGRPREFDPGAAAEKAMLVFWERGYEGASISELAAAMGIGKPSLYAAFGSKRGLFDAAMLRYENGPKSFAQSAFALPTARETVVALLHGVIEVSTRSTGPRGCLQTHAALACGAEADEVREAVANRRLAGEAKLCARLEKARESGELPPGTDTGVLAKFIAVLSQGITVQGAAGVPGEALREVVSLAMQRWP